MSIHLIVRLDGLPIFGRSRLARRGLFHKLLWQVSDLRPGWVLFRGEGGGEPRHGCCGQRPHQRVGGAGRGATSSEEHKSALQSLMRISYSVFCLKKTTKINLTTNIETKLNITT